MAKKKLSSEEQSQVSDMAERMAASTFKGNPKFGKDRKSQAFAISTSKVKNARRQQ